MVPGGCVSQQKFEGSGSRVSWRRVGLLNGGKSWSQSRRKGGIHQGMSLKDIFWLTHCDWVAFFFFLTIVSFSTTPSLETEAISMNQQTILAKTALLIRNPQIVLAGVFTWLGNHHNCDPAFHQVRISHSGAMGPRTHHIPVWAQAFHPADCILPLHSPPMQEPAARRQEFFPKTNQ